MLDPKSYSDGYARVVLTANNQYVPRGWYWAHELLADTTWNNYTNYAFRLCRELGWRPYWWHVPTSNKQGYWLFVRDEAALGAACTAWAEPRDIPGDKREESTL